MAHNTEAIVTVAGNGYEKIFSSYCESNSQYAKRHGMDYHLVQGLNGMPPADLSWLKLAMVLRLLNEYGVVAMIDADAFFSDIARNFTSLILPGKYIYGSWGWSFRITSCFMIFCAGKQTNQWIEGVLDDAENPVHPNACAPYENGHIIQHLQWCPFFAVLDKRWSAPIEHEGAFVYHRNDVKKTDMREQSRSDHPWYLECKNIPMGKRVMMYADRLMPRI